MPMAFSYAVCLLCCFAGLSEAARVEREGCEGQVDGQEEYGGDERKAKSPSPTPGAQAIPTTLKTGRALLIVNVQDCYLDKDTTTGEAGSAAVVDASNVIPVINKLRTEDCLFDVVVHIRDVHPEGHVSFRTTLGIPNYPIGTTLPMSCTVTECGCERTSSCCPDLEAIIETEVRDNVSAAMREIKNNSACEACFNGSGADCFERDQNMFEPHCLENGDSSPPPSLIVKDSDVIIETGQNPWVDFFSVFMDRTGHIKTGLEKVLKSHNVTELYFTGIGYDCTEFQLVDGAVGPLAEATELGFKAVIVDDASAGVHIDPVQEELESAGVKIISSETLLQKKCPKRKKKRRRKRKRRKGTRSADAL